MARIFSIIMLIAASSWAWLGDNYTGYGDTAVIQKFKADSLKYTRLFRMSAYREMRVDLLANDTSSTGFHADSCYFVWGLQTAHPIFNSAGSRDTAYDEEFIILDTFSRYDSLYFPIGAGSYIDMGTDGTYNNTKKMKDTLSVSGFAKQSRSPAIDYDVWVRGFVKGITGNDKGSFLNIRFNFLWREKE
jgi:hypothetical protein